MRVAVTAENIAVAGADTLGITAILGIVTAAAGDLGHAGEEGEEGEEPGIKN